MNGIPTENTMQAQNPPKSKVTSGSKPSSGFSVNTAIWIRFTMILAFIVIFMVLVVIAISSVRAVKEDVAMENINKASYYQAAISNPANLMGLESNLAMCDSNILKLEEQLDETVNFVLFVCGFNLICIVASTLSTMGYIRKHVVAPMILFEEEVEKLAVGQLDLDFSCDSRALEVQQLSYGLTMSTQELSRIVSILKIGVTELSNKNFNELPPAGFPGEFKAIEDGFRGLVSVVADTLREIVESAKEVTTGAQQVASGAQTLAHGATEQATSVDQLSETISDIAKMVIDTAESANSANELGVTASGVLDTSSKEMNELMSAIDQIERSSSDIEQIIKTIDDIAFQTNILALNAAIEAARAGQFGKSFAVVADEVRNLAQKSATAAHDTTALIDSSLEAIRRGASLAKSTNMAFSAAKENSMQMLDVVQHIADSSKLQSGSIENICSSVDQISAVITNNSATSEESAAASEELSSQAEIMTTMLGTFNIVGQSNSNHNKNLLKPTR